MRDFLGALVVRSCLAAMLPGAFVVFGCSAGDAPKAWNSFTTCLAGKAAQAPLVERVQQLRLIQLANSTPSGSKDPWPGRCAPLADELYAALPTSGEGSVLKRALGQKLGCTDDKGSCKLLAGPMLLSTTTALWDAAKDSALSSTEAPAGVPVPEAVPPPVLDSKTWKSLSDKPMKLAGPALAGDGRALILLKPTEGRARPSACEFTDGFSKVRCFAANPKMPELPAHTLEIVNDSKGVYAAGLTENGLVAYDLRTGEASQVRGRARQLLRDGVAVEPFAKSDVAADAPPKKGAKPDVKEEGFIAVQLTQGKAAKDVKLPIAGGIGDPISVGNHIVYLTQSEGGATFNAKALAHGRLRHEVSLKGPFVGSFHTCVRGDQVAVATFSGRAGLPNAKATAGADKTQVALVIFEDGRWGKTLEATLPFDRAFESDLVCTPSGASIGWVRSVEGGVTAGRVDCAKDGCKSNEAKLPGVESKWWWTVAPIGEKLLLLWRGALGETRQRIGALSELPSAKDTLLFDSPDFGGPNAGELSSVLGDSAALLVFRGEHPVALHAGSDGALRVLTP